VYLVIFEGPKVLIACILASKALALFVSRGRLQALLKKRTVLHQGLFENFFHGRILAL
jgi:hypothetical protein